YTNSRFHYFHSKDLLLNAAQKLPCLSDPHQGIYLYTDLSATTIVRRREFLKVTKTLLNNNVPY
ncbi:Hypothetical predicted protein, partial [Pelobates cultripes]